MRVLHVVDGTFLPKMDGVVVSLLNNANYMAGKGHAVAIAAPEYKGDRDKKQKNITVHRFSAFSFPSYPEMRVPHLNLAAFRKLVLDFKPDIMHTHAPGTLGILALLLGKRYNIPVVTTYHTSFPDVLMYLSPSKLLKLDEFAERLSEKGQTESLESIQQALHDILARLKNSDAEERRREFSRSAVLSLTNVFYNKHEVVISPSEGIRKDLKRHHLKSKVVVISNGIEIDKFRKKGKYRKFPKFLHVGRIAFEKKIDIILEALAIVCRRYPKAQLTIVGKGPALGRLKRLSRKLRLTRNVKFAGFVKRDMLPRIYRSHDVFVTASEMETQGIVLLEAIASGLPVIGVNVLAIPDVVHNKKTGFLVKRRDYKGMAKGMLRLIENPELISKYGKNARAEAEKHNLAESCRKMERLYEEIIH